MTRDVDLAPKGDEDSAVEAARKLQHLFARRVLEWFKAFGYSFPWRQSTDPYQILVAEWLLKRTTATAAANTFPRFLERFPNLETVAHSTERALVSALEPVGLQRQRGRTIKCAAAWLIKSCGGQIPNSFSKLKEVPGIGDYSARAIQCFAFGQGVAIVDSNVERIICRVFSNRVRDSATRQLVAEIAAALLPISGHKEFNYALLDIGRTICRYKDPACDRCPLSSLCDFVRGDDQSTSQRERTKLSTAATEIRSIRKKRGYSLKSLAYRSGVSKLTIIRLEAGTSQPRPATVRKIAKAMGVDPTRWAHK